MVPFVLFCALAPPMSLRGINTGVVLGNPPVLQISAPCQRCSGSSGSAQCNWIDTGVQSGNRLDCFQGPLDRGLLPCAGDEKRQEGAEGRRESMSHKVKGAVQELAEDVATLCKHPVYLSTVAGQTLYTGQLPCPQAPSGLPLLTCRACAAGEPIMTVCRTLPVAGMCSCAKHTGVSWSSSA